MSAAERDLLSALESTARGPRQNGVFALWLVLRLAHDLVVPGSAPAPAQRRRRMAVERRLASLTVPAPLRRGLTLALRELAAGSGAAGALALQQLVAPTREVLGADLAGVIAGAASEARDGQRSRGRETPT